LSLRETVGAAGRLCSAAAAVGLLLAACSTAEPVPPEVRVVDLRLLDSTVFEQRFEIDLRIGNPNDFALPLDGLTFELEVNGEDFARGFTNQRVTIPRLGEGTLSVVASTTLLELVEQMRLLAERGELRYRLDGTAYLRGFARGTAPYESEGALRLLSGAPGPERSI
jgi:LEA14-like dessication related protein